MAEQLGLPLAGVNLPVHFMLRLDEAGGTSFIDPFHGGAIYNRDECERKITELANVSVVLTDSSIRPCSNQIIVTRMLRNLKGIYANAKFPELVLPVQRRLTALNPHDAVEQRDLGILCAQTDHLGEAIDPLEAYLKMSPPDDEARELESLLQSIRRHLARWN
jgi:regulator of sirC expression with transglutaminase-like and TPR domain